MKLSKYSTTRTGLVSALGALLGIVTVALIAIGGAGAAAAAPKDGPISVLATLGNGPAGKIVVAGAIGDWGTALSIDKNGKPDENGNYVKVTLKKGTFEIDSTALNKKSDNPHPQIASDTTCSVSVSVSAPVTLLDGTGLYQGISGTVNATLTFSGVGGRYQSGAKKGQCEHGGTKPMAMLGTVLGRGTVRFG